MAHGFRAYNEGGYVQIDGDYSNYVLHSTGTASYFDETKSYACGSVTWRKCAISFSARAAPPLITARSVNGVAFSHYIKDAGGSFVGAHLYMHRDDISSDYAIYVPADYADIPTQTHGMVVYKSNGDVAFDSRVNYLRILDFGGGSIGHDDVGEPYYLMGSFRYYCGHSHLSGIKKISQTESRIITISPVSQHSNCVTLSCLVAPAHFLTTGIGVVCMPP